MMRVLALVAACLLLAPTTARAQAAPDIAGEWVMDAPLDPDDGCVITGNARLSVGANAAAVSARLSVRETCPGGGEWRAQQQCVGSRNADKLWLDCTIVSASPDTYVDDDFALRIHSGDLMDGLLLSSRRGRATWRRPSAPRIS
jgi:hypothetical protein